MTKEETSNIRFGKILYSAWYDSQISDMTYSSFQVVDVSDERVAIVYLDENNELKEFAPISLDMESITGFDFTKEAALKTWLDGLKNSIMVCEKAIESAKDSIRYYEELADRYRERWNRFKKDEKFF